MVTNKAYVRPTLCANLAFKPMIDHADAMALFPVVETMRYHVIMN